MIENIDNSKLVSASEVLKAIAHPTRISILNKLSDGKKHNVTDLYTMLCCEQATISHHLGILKNKGILVSQRVGKNTYYAIERNAFIDCILNSLIKKTIQIS